MVELACGSRSMRSVFLSRFASAAARLIADRKSTRLNSSHGYISYAVFCLKKKTYRYIISSCFLLTPGLSLRCFITTLNGLNFLPWPASCRPHHLHPIHSYQTELVRLMRSA